MCIFSKLFVLVTIVSLLFTGRAMAETSRHTIAPITQNTLNSIKSLSGVQLAHDIGYPHYHGNQSGAYYGGGRNRSYQYCSRYVFKPCRRNGGSYRYCNRQHHLCRYGHLDNCIRGRTC